MVEAEDLTYRLSLGATLTFIIEGDARTRRCVSDSLRPSPSGCNSDDFFSPVEEEVLAAVSVDGFTNFFSFGS